MTLKKRVGILAWSLFLASAAVNSWGATHTVTFNNSTFTPSDLTIDVGDSVTFQNQGGTHTVTGTGADPICGNIEVATNCTRTFSTAGTFPYRCVFHSTAGQTPTGMIGSITVTDAPQDKPNLALHKLDNWSDTLVATTAAGDYTEDSPITDQQDVYLGWAIVNESTAQDILQTFSTHILVDDQVKTNWVRNGLAKDMWNAGGGNIGKLSAGQHTLKMVIDATGAVAESDEADNVYEKTITVNSAGAGVNHTVTFSNNTFTPADLTINVGDSVTFQNQGGSHTVTGTGADPICGNDAVATSCKHVFNTPGTFPYRCLFHSTAGPPPAGMIGSITVVGAGQDKPNLAPYQLSNWSDTLVATTAALDYTEDSPITDQQDVYLSWTIVNGSTDQDVLQTFSTHILVDGQVKTNWVLNGLTKDTWNSGGDFNIGKLSAGQHTLKIVIDTTAAVAESNEADNVYEKTITVNTSGGGVNHTVTFNNFTFTPADLTINVGDSVTFQNQGGSHTVTGTGADPICGNDAVATSCKHVFNTPGTFPYRCLFHSTAGPPPTGMLGSITVAGNQPPVRFSAFKLTKDGFEFMLSGTPGRSYVLEASADLLAWAEITTLLNATGAVQYTDAGANGLKQRYYRARQVGL